MIRGPECGITCKNYIGVKEFGESVEEDERCICKAFPDGIPLDKIELPEDHKKPLPDQGNDVVYEKRVPPK